MFLIVLCNILYYYLLYYFVLLIVYNPTLNCSLIMPLVLVLCNILCFHYYCYQLLITPLYSFVMCLFVSYLAQEKFADFDPSDFTIYIKIVNKYSGQPLDHCPPIFIVRDIAFLLTTSCFAWLYIPSCLTPVWPPGDTQYSVASCSTCPPPRWLYCF